MKTGRHTLKPLQLFAIHTMYLMCETCYKIKNHLILCLNINLEFVLVQKYTFLFLNHFYSKHTYFIFILLSCIYLISHNTGAIKGALKISIFNNQVQRIFLYIRYNGFTKRPLRTIFILIQRHLSMDFLIIAHTLNVCCFHKIEEVH